MKNYISGGKLAATLKRKSKVRGREGLQKMNCVKLQEYFFV